MSTSQIASIWAGAVLLAAACTGQAATLAPAAASGSVFFNFAPPQGVQFNTFGNFPLSGPGGFVQYSAGATPSPFMFGEVTVGPGFTGRASGQLIYQVQIIGPAAEVPVSIAVAGSAAGSSNTTDLFSGFAMKSLWRLADVSLGLQTVFSEGIESGTLQGSFSQSFNHNVELTLTANHIYLVTLTADAFAGAASGPSAFASAFIDPVFSFAAGVGPEYSFQFSEGIGNAPVPEPSALVLLSVGLLALGLRRRGLCQGGGNTPG
jgi:hypothetical protein